MKYKLHISLLFSLVYMDYINTFLTREYGQIFLDRLPYMGLIIVFLTFCVVMYIIYNRCVYEKETEEEQKKLDNILSKIATVSIAICLIITLVIIYPIVKDLLDLFCKFNIEKADHIIWIIVSYTFGLITGVIYSNLSENFQYLLKKYNNFLYFIGMPIIILSFYVLNTFTNSILFVSVYCLFGSFLGTELFNLWNETKKKGTNIVVNSWNCCKDKVVKFYKCCKDKVFTLWN